MGKKSRFPLELASLARIIFDNLPGGAMRCCINKSAAYVGYQPQLPSGSQSAFSFPLLNQSCKKAPPLRGFFLSVIHGKPDAASVYSFCVYRTNRQEKNKNGQSALSKTHHFD
ncbi:hypothetical protein [Brenneria salicis]|nr:hypothetical protein [Brenneria salicis]